MNAAEKKTTTKIILINRSSKKELKKRLAKVGIWCCRNNEFRQHKKRNPNFWFSLCLFPFSGMFLQPPSSATAKQTNKQLPVNMISVLFVSTNILFWSLVYISNKPSNLRIGKSQFTIYFNPCWKKMLRSINLPLVYDFFPTSALNTCQKFARLEARAKLWHLLGHSGKLLTITKAIEVIFSAAVLGSRSPAKTAIALHSRTIC